MANQAKQFAGIEEVLWTFLLWASLCAFSPPRKSLKGNVDSGISMLSTIPRNRTGCDWNLYFVWALRGRLGSVWSPRLHATASTRTPSLQIKPRTFLFVDFFFSFFSFFKYIKYPMHDWWAKLYTVKGQSTCVRTDPTFQCSPPYMSTCVSVKCLCGAPSINQVGQGPAAERGSAVGHPTSHSLQGDPMSSAP